MSSSTDVKSDRRYTRDHEWAKPDDGGIVVGITPFAVEQLGDITMVNFDVAEGDELEAGKPFGTVESVKTVSDLFAPVTGRVVRLNAELDSKPELVNEDCWTAGWMLVIAPTDPASATQHLLDAQAYRSALDSESH